MNWRPIPLRSACAHALPIMFIVMATLVVAVGRPSGAALCAAPFLWNSGQPPEAPMRYELRELWNLESMSADGELVYGTVDGVALDDDGNIYLLDRQLMRVHLLGPDGTYLRAIGQTGEGPEDMGELLSFHVKPEGIVGCVDGRRVVLYDREGQYAGEWVPQLPGCEWFAIYQALPIEGGYVGTVKTRSREGRTYTYRMFAGVFEESGELRCKLQERSWTYARGDVWVKDEERDEIMSIVNVGADGLVYLSARASEYRIDVYDAQGVLLRGFGREYDPVRRTAEEMADMRNFEERRLERIPEHEIRLLPIKRNIVNIYGRGEDELWLETSRSWHDLPQNVASIMDIYDSGGRFMRHAILEKQIDPENDIPYLLKRRVLIAYGAWSAWLAARGVSSEVPDLDKSGDAPRAVMCELVAVQG